MTTTPQDPNHAKLKAARAEKKAALRAKNGGAA